MKILYFLCTYLLLMSCENEDITLKEINYQGIDIATSRPIVKGEFELERVQYSTGEIRYVLTGVLELNEEDRKYAIVTIGDPRVEAFEIVHCSFPLEDTDSLEYSCALFIQDKMCEVTWTRDDKRLFIRNSISARH